MNQQDADDRRRFAELIAEFDSLDATRDVQRRREVLLVAAQVVDRTAEPKKWAALRSQFAMLSESVDPRAAIEAYRDALTVWTSEEDHDPWVACHSGIGSLMCQIQPFGPDEIEEAISHLESVIADQPWFARSLAELYKARPQGDPAENWSKRIGYLQLAISQISRTDDPIAWARCQNEIGTAFADEPGADYAQAIERRIVCHEESLAALRGSRDAAWIETCVNLSECFLYRTLGESRGNEERAEQYARDAVKACVRDHPAVLRITASLALVRALSGGQRGHSSQAIQDALRTLAEIRPLIAPNNRALLATVESFRANVYYQLIVQGERQWLQPLVASAEEAAELLEGPLTLRERRSILQVAGEALLEAEEYEWAASFLERALQAADAALSESKTTAGRMERIWEYHDSSALVSYSYLKLNRISDALEALDLGKARFWNPPREAAQLDDLQRLVPAGGALLFANFAARQGAVIVVTQSDIDIAWLPQFGKARLTTLLQGDLAAKQLGGWLSAYYHRSSQPEAWRREIERLGGVLYDEMWTSVLDKLAALGVQRGAELVWFPQGGCGAFPVHAAWTGKDAERRWLVEDFAVRYAPSVHSLRAATGQSESARPTLLVANPTGDLEFSELECAWVRRTLGSQAFSTLHHQQATKDAVLAQVPSSATLHMSAHASFDVQSPLHSKVLLANQQPLTLEEWFPHLLQYTPQTVVLSACETAIARVHITPDEFLGFPAAFLATGARTVLATLWPVDDEAAGLVIAQFYRERAKPQTSAAEALRRSQDWLRRLKVRDVMKELRELRTEPAPVGPLAARVRSRLWAADLDSCPYEQPYYWAAFTISGD